MKKKAFHIGIAIALLSALALIWYTSPTYFAKDIDADDIEYFSIFDGQTGTGFQVDDPVYISMIVRNLQNIAVWKNGISIGAMGYGFKIEGDNGLRDRGGLEAAAAAPLQSFGGNDLYPSDIEKIVRLGYQLILREGELADMFISIAEGRVQEPDLLNWLQTKVN